MVKLNVSALLDAQARIAQLVGALHHLAYYMDRYVADNQGETHPDGEYMEASEVVLRAEQALNWQRGDPLLYD